MKTLTNQKCQLVSILQNEVAKICKEEGIVGEEGGTEKGEEGLLQQKGGREEEREKEGEGRREGGNCGGEHS